MGRNMNELNIDELFLSADKKGNAPFKINLFGKEEVQIYSKSVRESHGIVFFLARIQNEKYLFLYYKNSSDELAGKFEGVIQNEATNGSFIIKKCELSTTNRKAIQSIFPFTKSVKIGLDNSFGFGDRLGLANAAHLRAVSTSEFKPILAQQSIRELTRTNRTPANVMDAAVWAILEEGYEKGFGSDADHLKTTGDIDLMIKDGFTMFTFDPGDYVNNSADTISEKELDKEINNLNWKGLRSNIKEISDTYLDTIFKISDSLIIKPDLITLKRALVKYGNAIAHIKNMYDYLVSIYSDYDTEVEISVDETESITTPFEHFFFVKELNRLEVIFISLAPRFIGDFEKGIDYKGDIELFKTEYHKHLAITRYFNNYKISLHSGSDKFRVYEVIGSIKKAHTHIKTAGTSYLEALKVAALKEPELFREIFDYCTGLYEEEKKSYHVSADIKKLKAAKDYSDEELVKLLFNDDARQVLHVTYGRVLTDKKKNGSYKFKDRLFECLKANEETYYEIIEKHFDKHLKPFK
jgi:hypothetical protein